MDCACAGCATTCSRRLAALPVGAASHNFNSSRFAMLAIVEYRYVLPLPAPPVISEME